MKVLKKFWIHRPKDVIFYVTNQCACRCIHCFYQKQLGGFNPPREDIKKIIRALPRVRFVSLTGGEPFVRTDISAICKHFLAGTGARTIEINTNGYFPRRVEETVRNVMEDFPRNTMFIQVSLLGTEKVHNKISGVGDSFLQMDRTLDRLVQLRRRYKNLRVTVCFPVMKANYTDIDNVVRYLGKKKVRAKFSPLKSADVSVFHADISLLRDLTVLRRDLFLSIPEYESFLRRLESLSGKSGFRFWTKEDRIRNELYLRLMEGKLTRACRARLDTIVIFPNGDMSLCEFIRPVGNLKAHTFSEIMGTDAAKLTLKETKNCRCAQGVYLHSLIRNRFRFYGEEIRVWNTLKDWFRLSSLH